MVLAMNTSKDYNGSGYGHKKVLKWFWLWTQVSIKWFLLWTQVRIKRILAMVTSISIKIVLAMIISKY